MTEGKYGDIFRGPRHTVDTPWDKPMVFDEKSLPSREDSARFNVAVVDGAAKELRGETVTKAVGARTGAAPEEWSPSARPRWKAAALAAAVVLATAAFAFSLLRTPPSDRNTIPAAEASSASLEDPLVPPPLMANPVADGTMKFQVLTVTIDVPTLSGAGETLAANNGFLLVDMKVTNAGESPTTFDPLAQRVITSSGRQYGPRIEAQKLLSSDPDLVTPMNPSRDVEVKLAFDIPHNEVPVMLFLHSAAGSYGTTVKFA